MGPQESRPDDAQVLALRPRGYNEYFGQIENIHWDKLSDGTFRKVSERPEW